MPGWLWAIIGTAVGLIMSPFLLIGGFQLLIWCNILDWEGRRTRGSRKRPQRSPQDPGDQY